MSKEHSIPTPALALGLAGLLPFAALTCAAWMLQDYERFPFEEAQIAYGAVILSFLGGVKWGTHMLEGKRCHQWYAMLLSIIPSLLGWMALLLAHVPALILLIVGFALQYQLDARSSHRGELPIWYSKLRLILSSIVIICLLASLIKVAMGPI